MILRPPTSTSTSNTPTPTQAPTTESNTNTGGSNNVFSPLLAYATGLVTPLTSGTTNPFLSTPTYPPPPGSPDLGTPASPTIAHLQQQHPYPFHHHHQHPASPHYPASPHSHYHSHYHSHAALSLLSTPIPPSPAFQSLSQTLVRARVGLIQELVEVFNIVEVGGRPNIGGRQGTRGEWTIGPGLVLPVPGDIRRYPPDHINAVLTLTLHFVNLLSFYLGVKLPFEVVWSGGKVGLGVPWIGAIKGGPVSGEGGGSASWARWYTKHPLHLSNSPSTASPGLSSPSSLSTPSSSSNSHHPSSPHTDTSTPSRTKIPQAQPLQSPSSSSSSKSTPTAGEKSTRRTSLMGLAAGVVGFATGGRVRSVSGSSASSRGVSAGYASSPLRPSDEHGGAGERRSGDGGTRLEGEEEEEDEESRRAMEESMIAAMPLPGPSPVVGRRASLSVNTAVAAVGGARGSGQPATPTRHSNTTSHPTPSTPTSSHPTSSTTPTSTPTSTTPSSAATSSTTSTQNSTSTTSPTPSFTTALAMLIYNVLYLGHTQGVEIPLHACGEVLSNLWRVCCAGEGEVES
ncbi:hypothetical protein CC2G_000033 [Coprinopsis cinerea AmutBmut pab1-1]|nr:hypothetical protein CC2G_000033 [Coprinopsis cinerea AmutBmut pab1-1]